MQCNADPKNRTLSPIRIFVGTTEDQMLSTKILEFTVKRAASRPVEVVPLHHAGIMIPVPKEARNRPRTPFSFQRFLIPRLCDYQGKGIYVDSDMQVFKDIGEVWDLPIDAENFDLFTVNPGPGAIRKRQFSVVLLNCDRLRWNIQEIVSKLDGGELNYEKLMYEMVLAPRIDDRIGPEWNHLERYEPGVTSLIHYTDMPTQPWVSTKNKLGHLWTQALFDALDAGFLTREYVADHVANGWVRPSLLFQIDNRLADSLRLPREALTLDRNFVAPFKKLAQFHGGRAISGQASRNLYARSMRWLRDRVGWT